MFFVESLERIVAAFGGTDIVGDGCFCAFSDCMLSMDVSAAEPAFFWFVWVEDAPERAEERVKSDANLGECAFDVTWESLSFGQVLWFLFAEDFMAFGVIAGGILRTVTFREVLLADEGFRGSVDISGVHRDVCLI